MAEVIVLKGPRISHAERRHVSEMIDSAVLSAQARGRRYVVNQLDTDFWNLVIISVEREGHDRRIEKRFKLVIRYCKPKAFEDQI